MTEAARRAGDAIANSAGDLARIWRGARAQTSPDVWPGLLDGIADDLFLRVGEGLAIDRDATLVWPDLVGTVRIDPLDRERSRAEMDAEWDVAEAVLARACEALEAGADVRAWLGLALATARAGSRALGDVAGPRGILVIWWIAGLAFARPPERVTGGP